MKQRFTHFTSSDASFDLFTHRVDFKVHFKDRGESQEITATVNFDEDTQKASFIYDYRVPIRHRHRFETQIHFLAIKVWARTLLELGGTWLLMALFGVIAVLFILFGYHPIVHAGGAPWPQ